MRYVIIAPHPDDEIIGCFGLIHSSKDVVVWYPSAHSIQDSVGPNRVQSEYGAKILLGNGIEDFRNNFYYPEVCLVAPDPYFETHPEHRYWGHEAETKFRRHDVGGLMTYSTRMNAPYIFEVSDPSAKKEALDYCYPEKSDLWKYDHRYFLFEGRCQWHRPHAG